ncbi:hypothetical protein AAFC00_006472 [Neodothiora populina]|uniref:N-acetylglucosamine-induced protein 1 n=1 Tax=Neodothiora populina TaxID=2781224 RepID=A0ABR3P5M3_9PEZI
MSANNAPDQSRLPYWQVNVPIDKRPAECPDFLADANEKDRGILATPDSQYHRFTWPELKELIRTNRIDLFQRKPTDLRRYKEYMFQLKREHGSVMDFVMKERLHWNDLQAKGAPFTIPSDLKILYNDWPYGIDKRIVHLVVWTKFPFDEDTETGDLTAKARKEIDDYVNETFRSKMPAEHVIWFKNWASLKTIHAIEHFHVMLFDADKDFLKVITNADVAMADKFVGSAED